MNSNQTLNKSEVDLIRYVESNILDRQFKNYPALSWKDEYITPYLVKLLGDITRDLKSHELRNYSSFVIRRELKKYIHSLGWCIKWVSTNKQIAKKPKLSEHVLNMKIMDALRWGVDYHILVQNHVAWSRGALEAKIDSSTKTITFLPPETKAFQFGLIQDLDLDEVMDEIYDKVPVAELKEYYENRKAEIKWDSPPLQFDWSKAKEEPIFKTILNWLEQTMIPEISNTEELDGYSMGSLRKILAGMLIHSYLITEAEDEIDKRTNYTNIFGTCPIVLSKKSMKFLLWEWSGESDDLVENFIRDFSFDIANFHSSLTNQPFVRMQNGNLVLLPRLIVHLDFSRMVSGALNKGLKKQVYDRIITKIEKKSLDNLHVFFISNNYTSLKEIALKDQKQIFTPDFILINKETKSFFVIDYKHFLVPINANESLFKLSEIRKGLKKLGQYKSALINNRQLFESYCTKDYADYSVTAILLLNSPIPVPIVDQEEIKILTVNQFKGLIKDKVGEPLKNKVDDFIANKVSSIKRENGDPRIIEKATSVKDWTYIRSIYVT